MSHIVAKQKQLETLLVTQPGDVKFEQTILTVTENTI